MRIAIFDESEYYLYLERLLRQIHETAGSTVTRYGALDLLAFDMTDCRERFDILIMVLSEHKNEEINVASQSQRAEACCQLIFIAPDDRLITAVYQAEHVYTLSRADVPTMLVVAIQKAVSKLMLKDRRVVCITVNYEKRWIPLREIYYLENVQRKTHVCLEQSVFETSVPIQQILSEFQTTQFVRCHKSIYVNMQKIIGIGTVELLLLNQVRLPIGRVFKPLLEDCFQAFLGRNMPGC